MKKKYMPALIVCLLIVLLAVAGGATYIIRKYIPTKAQMNLTEYYGPVEDGEAVVIMESEIMEQRGLVSGDQVYLPLNIVNAYLNQRYYWDGENQQIIYAEPSQITSVPASDEGGTEVWLKDGNVYLSLDYIRQYTDVEAVVSTEPARVAVRYRFNGVNIVTATKDTAVRYRGGIKSEILTTVKSGEDMIFLEELENWTQVVTKDGCIGYVEKKKITPPEMKMYDRAFAREEYSYLSMDEPVNLVWHQVTNMEANAGLLESTQNMTGVNVISPTWFSIADNSGNITNLASADYVNQAHEKGLKVWGLVDNFSPDISTTEVLSHTASRRNLIDQLVNAALNAGMDGINVDLEALSEEVGIHFLQFLRELSVETHKNKLVLSVDNPVPEDFTSHYDRAEQGRVVDYVIIMGYDEHYVGSAEAGSVASLPWVEKGIADTIAEVPPQRVINAIPFYTRLWKTEGGALTSEAVGMDTARQAVDANGAEVYWSGDAGQNYGSYEKEGADYQVWLEDAESIKAKVMLVPKYGLAGVAAWKLGFENSGIWQVISENIG